MFPTSTKAAAYLPGLVANHQQQQQTAPNKNNMMMMNNSNSNNKSHAALPYTTTTMEAIQRYSFVPVFPSSEDIQGAAVDNNDDITKPSKGQVPWCCIECDSQTFGHKCSSCGRPRETGALRVFVGKLNREGSAETCHAMLKAFLTSESTRLSGPVLHIEPHTHASNGRGKGCTWIYVRSARDVKTIVDCIHNRTFVAVHPTTGEVGFIPFPASCDAAEIEGVFQYDHDNRPRFVHYLLHRGRVTAEIPESMQQDVFAKLNNTFVGKIHLQQKFQQQQQQQNQFCSVNKPSHTQQMINNFSNNQKAASALVDAAIARNVIPAGFQHQITMEVPLPPPKPYNAPSYLSNHQQNQQQQQQAVVEPPRPELATASWFYEDAEDNEDNDFGQGDCDDNNNEQLEEEQVEVVAPPTPKTTCKCVLNNGRYMWNPY